MSSWLGQDFDIYALAPRILGTMFLTWAGLKYVEAKRSPLNDIPTVGYDGPILSYITAFKYMLRGNELLQEGYEKYPNQAFKFAEMSKWIVVIGGQKLLDELRKAPDDTLSFMEAVSESTQLKWTMGSAIDEDPYHTATVRSPLTRNLVLRFDDIRDEIQESFTDYIPPKNEWVAFTAYDTIMHIVCRVSNRYFVGLPLCRDPGWRTLNETFTISVTKSARIINCFPNIFKPIVGSMMTQVSRSIKEAIGYVGPMIEERLAMDEQYGSDWEGKPNDLISWLLESAQGYQRTVADIAHRILAINFAAIHTSTMSFTQALYDLAAHPEYVKEMREEAEAIIKEHGWTKAAMQKMRKVDSFMKESQRLNSIGSMLMGRKAIKDWRLTNGTLIPKGTYIGVASDAMNKDTDAWQEARTFKGFRFSDMRDGDGDLDSIKHTMISLGLDHVVFGHGRHACPGRFFAVNELKAMFAYVLLTYDVRFENGSLERPQNLVFEASIIPDPRMKVMFRKRAAV